MPKHLSRVQISQPRHSCHQNSNTKAKNNKKSKLRACKTGHNMRTSCHPTRKKDNHLYFPQPPHPEVCTVGMLEIVSSSPARLLLLLLNCLLLICYLFLCSFPHCFSGNRHLASLGCRKSTNLRRLHARGDATLKASSPQEHSFSGASMFGTGRPLHLTLYPLPVGGTVPCLRSFANGVPFLVVTHCLEESCTPGNHVLQVLRDHYVRQFTSLPPLLFARKCLGVDVSCHPLRACVYKLRVVLRLLITKVVVEMTNR